MSDNCPCGLPQTYEKCCARYIEKKEIAPTVEAMLRARYTAHVVKNVDFVLATQISKEEEEQAVRENVEAWIERSEWMGLEVINTKDGGADDDKGQIEFLASYQMGRERFKHHEISLFEKREGQWFFVEGAQQNKTQRNESVKVGRNDPCSCGSGKKFKKCCGA